MTSIPSHRPPPHSPYAPRASRANPWLVRLPILFVGWAVLLVVVLGIFLAAFQFRYSDLVMPGVSALGVDLGGMTYDEARAALASRFTYDRDAVFTIRHGDQFWQMRASELGVSFDLNATVDAAFAVGHTDNVVTNIAAQASAWVNGRSIAPVVRYDQNIAASRLLEIAQEINRDPANASLTINGGQVVSTPGQTGRSVDIRATIARLDEIIINLSTGAEIPLVVNETPPVVWNADDAVSRAQLALSGPVTLVATAPDGTPLGPWVATVDQIAALLVIRLVDNGDGTQRYDVTINMQAFETYLNDLAPGLIVSGQDARFHFNEATGQLELIQPAITGRELDIPTTLQRLEEGVFTPGNRTVPMAFVVTQPRFHNNVTASELGITQLVSEATTYFTGSSINRRTNIAVAASRFDGLIVPPGEEFSFNYWLGPLTYEAGFVDGLVIFSGQTVTGIGGGVCQVSTTVFRAAFTGGFQIIERNNHGYRVAYYELNGQPMGLDAAIWTPDRDFRFQNDTPYHILIETEVSPSTNTLQFRFYSTDTGRRVEIEAPIVRDVVPAPPPRFVANSDLRAGEILQVDFAADGADVTVYRNIYDANGELIRRDYIYTHYLEWQAVYEVAPGDARLNQNTG